MVKRNCKKENTEPRKYPGREPNTLDDIKTGGTIYWDNSLKDRAKGGPRYHNCWRAEIFIDKQRYRYRSKSRLDCEEWLDAVCQKRIKPTDNKADWWRMEQRKDMDARNEEILKTNAEEAVMLADFYENRDLSAIYHYMVQRLLPHMYWYCAHTLNLGKDTTITAAREACAKLLVRITGNKPVTSMTWSLKRMLRVYKEHGHFSYYEKAPDPVKLVVNKIDFTELAKVWKATKDRRL